MREFYTPSFREILDNSAEKYGDKTFIKYKVNDEIIEKSFIQLREDSLAACRYLRNISTEKMHIAILGNTSYEFIVFATAILISGNVFVPFAPDLSLADSKDLFERADIDFVVHSAAWCETREKLLPELNLKGEPVNTSDEALVKSILDNYGSDSEYASLSEFEDDPNSLAVLIYTSGTSGVKKGVMHSQKSFIANVMYKEYVEYQAENTCYLSVLPMHHVFCFSGDYVRSLRDGLTVCINGNMRDLGANLKIFHPNVMLIVPMIAQSLLKAIKATLAKDPSLDPKAVAQAVYGGNIEWLFSGGAYLPPELVNEYNNLGIYLRQGYGMTEAGCRVSVPDPNCSLDSVGRVVDIAEVRIVDGEIQVNTPSVMLGYYKMPEETAAAFTEDGWLRTGDSGYVTDYGELFVTGRLKNLIILSSGENVSPEAIEKKFNSYEIVSEILVYAENDSIVADIYPNYDYCEQNRIENPADAITLIVKELNFNAKASHVISKVNVTDTPLERTESGKIKRKAAII